MTLDLKDDPDAGVALAAAGKAEFVNGDVDSGVKKEPNESVKSESESPISVFQNASLSVGPPKTYRRQKSKTKIEPTEIAVPSSFSTSVAPDTNMQLPAASTRVEDSDGNSWFLRPKDLSENQVIGSGADAAAIVNGDFGSTTDSGSTFVLSQDGDGVSFSCDLDDLLQAGQGTAAVSGSTLNNLESSSNAVVSIPNNLVTTLTNGTSVTNLVTTVPTVMNGSHLPFTNALLLNDGDGTLRPPLVVSDGYSMVTTSSNVVTAGNKLIDLNALVVSALPPGASSTASATPEKIEPKEEILLDSDDDEPEIIYEETFKKPPPQLTTMKLTFVTPPSKGSGGGVLAELETDTSTSDVMKSPPITRATDVLRKIQPTKRSFPLPEAVSRHSRHSTTLTSDSQSTNIPEPSQIKKRRRRGPRLCDVETSISAEEFKYQLKNYSDLIHQYPMAPYSKRSMHLVEFGGVERLFSCPGFLPRVSHVNVNVKPDATQKLSRLLMPNLVTNPVTDEADGTASQLLSSFPTSSPF